MIVNEIFYSIEGEGLRAGAPCIFVRFAGCKLRCSYCDTKYARSMHAGIRMNPNEVMENIKKYSCKLVTLTGGEPLEQSPDELQQLLDLLWDEDYEVNIETDGAEDIEPYQYTHTFITMDYKLPSSGMEGSMNIENLAKLRYMDCIKFVVGSKEDLDRMVQVVETNKIEAKKFISPVFGSIEPSTIVEYMKDHKLTDYKIQLQLHKFIWDKDTRGV